MKNIKNKDIFNISSINHFNDIALNIFNYQYENNKIYKQYVDLLDVNYKKISNINEIPFLPIEFFKTHKILSNSKKIKQIFYSSGTTTSIRSKHYITDLNIYKESFIKSFNYFYGNISKYCILGLLPNYHENKNSSLIYMMKNFIELSNCKSSGFYIDNYNDLYKTIINLKNKNKKYILIGVSYALMDFSEKFNLDLSDGILIETGGMKGKRKELTKKELHSIFKNNFKIENVHSEYGMTELLSQAYSKGNGIFEAPKWMKILIRDIYDPLSFLENGKTGGINIIDLANINSCSFIETKDLGKLNNLQQFEILGRFDDSDIRGCNLLVNN